MEDQTASSNSSVYCATEKQPPSWHSSGPRGALTGQLGDGSHQVQLSVPKTTVLLEPKLCPVVILGPGDGVCVFGHYP